MTASPSQVFAVIMAGGVGARFWPASRKRSPKQLLPLGPTSEPLLAATLRRVGALASPAHTFIVTGESLREPTLEVAASLPRANVLAEPLGRNTAPCVAWAAVHVEAVAPGSVMAVLPADHHIGDEAEYGRVLARAAAAAADGTLVTVGLKPSRPETGYGYIEVGEAVAEGTHAVARFVEKPTLARAEEFLRSGQFLWNSGMFFFRSDVILREIGRHMPALHAAMTEIGAAIRAGTEAEAVARLYPTLESISIDFGVMERAANVRVVPGDFGWSDLGSWTTAWELATKDGAGNALPEGSIAVDAANNYARTKDGKMVAVLGVSDLVIVDTDDALLILPRERAQEVRKVVDSLTARGDKRL